ncbi:LysR family transcriptional regulator [Dasania sp. GY-MA-18]|uniref:LysR family transcriptional regulator n=1 Tax=Dasania phycosphaerae TaxID=2950436 RepID=A0A9J6RNJ8_9GAMM|nr:MULTISPECIES: LysR family transcriptional regulator [Dasania]MCR8923149.1 LysR family transcriptional regulator [Dasania sp. GY-MA-18]MCZ0865581.1 LysR family transcriptional regulator [Dasania phycosphaerae]MCZ0869306.1 LysR family transcriptional regulator [Dasania phycosphaerae]
MTMNLKQLRYFLAVVEVGNVTKASQNLYISQPAISNAIKQLEDYLDVQLLIRSHAKGVSLTEAGKDLAVKAKALLSYAEDVENQVRDLGQALSGELSIGCFVTLAPFLLPGLMKALKEQYPKVSLKVLEGNAEQLQAALMNGDIELALMYDLALNPSLDIKVKKVAPPYVVLPANHTLAQNEKVKLSELKDMPYILLDLPLSREYFLSIFDAADIIPNIFMRTGSYELVRSMVAAEQGYSVLAMRPQHATTYYGEGEVACVALQNPCADIAVVLAAVEGLRLSRKAEAFKEICSDLLALQG